MRRLPRSIVALMVFLAVVFNLERIRIEEVHVIDLKGFVYVLILLVPLTVILVPIVRRQSLRNLVLGAASLYALGKFGLFRYWTVWDEYAIHLMIAELALLNIGLLLGVEIGRNIDDFNAAVQNVIFRDTERAHSLRDAAPLIEKEIVRSRRHDRPLALVVVQPDAGSSSTRLHLAVEEVQRSLTRRYFTVNLARAISERLRPSDMIIHSGRDDRLLILCPETTLAELEEVVARLEQTAGDAGMSIACGRASFPGDALTFQDLMNSAINDLDSKDGHEGGSSQDGSSHADRSTDGERAGA